VAAADESGAGVGPRAGDVSAESTFGASVELLNGDPGGSPPQG
jgi:hypothetical protein